jgi:hypothetical protein
MTREELIAFGYNTSQVTGWANGTVRWYLDNRKIPVKVDNFSVYKTEDQAWKAAERHYNKNFNETLFALLKEKEALRESFYKSENKLYKKAKSLGYERLVFSPGRSNV